MKTEELLQLLASEYQPPSRAFLPEFRAATGYGNGECRCDALAMDLWQSNKYGLELHGFELKVSRADWLRELKQPLKSEEIKRFCDRWYVVAANSKIVKYADELPKGWGLEFAENGKLVNFIEAEKLTPEPYGRGFLASVMRRATRIDGLS